MKPILLDEHTRSRMAMRGASEAEVKAAIREAKWERARKNRSQCRKSYPFGRAWNGRSYNTKQVKVIFEESELEIVVDTVYVFYF